jgi:hypothetical protein
MSCRGLDRLLAGGREAEFTAHRATCDSCGELAREMEQFAQNLEGLRPPAPSRTLYASLYEIPRKTVSCEAAEELLARAAENEIAPADAARLHSHFTRCAGCVQAAGVLGVARELVPPQANPWLATRLLGSRPKAQRKTSLRSWLLGPRGAIAVAYAAVLLVMALGLNPADLARKAGTARLEQTARAGVQVARNTVLDQFGAFQERAFRTFEAMKGRVGGYGRAALSNALALVMRSDTSRRPSRPRNEDGSGAWKRSEIEIWTWRADGTPGGQS